MSEVAVQVEGLSKLYRIGGKQQRYKTFRDALTTAAGAPFRRIGSAFRKNQETVENTTWALRDVSFDVKRGEVVGLIGRNGAGKSTLLKILARITEPTVGRAVLRGRVGSLLEVGSGFHNELTGRENIYLNGAILGMKRAEIDRKFDEIVDFAEVEKFIDTPVKHYSSGMYMRLAFAVAAHLEPEILLVDEVLAVGDAAFQKKCLGKIGDVSHEGRTVLFVSHNMAAVASLCRRTALLSGGRIAMVGPTQEALTQYIASTTVAPTQNLEDRLDRDGDGRVRFSAFATLDDQGFEQDTIQSGARVTFRLDYRSAQAGDLKNVLMEVKISDGLGAYLFTLSSYLTGQILDRLPREGTVCCDVPSFPLLPGIYSATLVCHVNGELSDHVSGAADVSVIEGDFYGSGRVPKKLVHGFFLVSNSWRIADRDQEGTVPR